MMNKKEKKEMEDMQRAIVEMNQMVAGAKAKEELMLDYIDNLCGMIESETPIKEHDRWLDDCVHMGWYRTHEDRHGDDND